MPWISQQSAPGHVTAVTPVRVPGALRPYAPRTLWERKDFSSSADPASRLESSFPPVLRPRGRDQCFLYTYTVFCFFFFLFTTRIYYNRITTILYVLKYDRTPPPPYRIIIKKKNTYPLPLGSVRGVFHGDFAGRYDKYYKYCISPSCRRAACDYYFSSFFFFILFPTPRTATKFFFFYYYRRRRRRTERNGSPRDLWRDTVSTETPGDRPSR